MGVVEGFVVGSLGSLGSPVVDAEGDGGVSVVEVVAVSVAVVAVVGVGVVVVEVELKRGCVIDGRRFRICIDIKTPRRLENAGLGIEGGMVGTRLL